MSKRKNKDQITVPGRYVAVRHEILDSPAWKATSFGARLLYIALRRRLIYRDNNNGDLFLSTREAAAEIGARQMNIADWYHELVHYGFIIMTNPHHLGIEGRDKAARWRLTDWRHGKSFDGTKDYLKWDGTLFERRHRRPPPKTESRSTPRFRVKHPTLHMPEATHASGKPESEAPHASYQGGAPEATHASYLDQPFPQPRNNAESNSGNSHKGPPLTVMSLIAGARPKLH